MMGVVINVVKGCRGIQENRLACIRVEELQPESCLISLVVPIQPYFGPLSMAKSNRKV